MHDTDRDAVFDQIFRAAVAGLPAPVASSSFDDRVISEVIPQTSWRGETVIGLRRFALAMSMALAVFFPLTFALTPSPHNVSSPLLTPGLVTTGSVPMASSAPAQMQGNPAGRVPRGRSLAPKQKPASKREKEGAR